MGAKSSKEKQSPSQSPGQGDKERQYRTEYHAYNNPKYAPKPKVRSPSLEDFKPFSKIDRQNPFRPPGMGQANRPAPLPKVQIESVDLLTEANAALSHTEMYNAGGKLVVRRGCTFRLMLALSEPIDDLDQYTLSLTLGRGKAPNRLSSSLFEVCLEGNSPRDWEWSGKLDRSEGKELEIAVSIPVDAPIGEYTLSVKACSLENNGEQTVQGGNVAVLFNPWHKDDDVFMSDASERDEYVMNCSGTMWMGLHDSVCAKPWEYNQFEPYSLDAAMHLLDKSGLGSDLRRSAVHVTRTCTQMVNADDNEGGILVGNWSGNYYGGTRPSSWSGSGAILEQYWRTKEPVKFAQCWVFGGTLTSVLRALGVPSRPVTNFLSAHDTDASRTVDYYYDRNHQELPNLCSDTTWNYHVWVEGWMERPDLKGGVYGGWQALDSTPQEPMIHSGGGMFTLGPAPLPAIKDQRDLKYDAEFVVSEVNADVCYHLLNSDTGMFTQAKSNTSRVGKKMLTQSIDSSSPVDVMHGYKYPEFSVEEREAMKAGLLRRKGKKKTIKEDSDADDEEDDDDFDNGEEFGKSADLEPPSELEVEIVTPSDIMIGEDVVAKLVLRSSLRKNMKVNYSVKVNPSDYKGQLADSLCVFQSTKKLGPNEKCEIPLEVTSAQYLGRLLDQYLINFSVFVTCEQLDFAFLDCKVFRFEVPEMVVTSPEAPVKVGETAEVTATFKNPMSTELIEAEWYVEASTLTQPLTLIGERVEPDGEASVTFKITPRTAVQKEFNLSVSFQSHRLAGLVGRASVKVEAAAVQA
nr:protein-glutamine gamma-glutamyltransferase K-like isoform X1 [Halisarca dujardinii]